MYDPLLCTSQCVCVNRSPVLSLGNDAPAEESCWGLSVSRAQSLRTINNWVRLEPCTSWGLSCRMGQILLKGVLYEIPVSFFIMLFTFEDLAADVSYRSHLRLFRSDKSCLNIQHQTAGFFFLCCLRLLLLKPWLQTKTLLLSVWSQNITSEEDQMSVCYKQLCQRLFWGICDKNRCPDESADTCFLFHRYFKFEACWPVVGFREYVSLF